jgi:hypothetical protein
LTIIALHGQQDSIVVELTAYQKQKINQIDQQFLQLKKQYNEQVKIIQVQFAELLALISDANGIDPKKYSQPQVTPDKLIFREPKKEKK